jgi:hypothetical protein
MSERASWRQFQVQGRNTGRKNKVLDFSAINIPPEIAEWIQTAAAESNVTEVERVLDDMAGLGDDERLLAEHLKDLSQEFKFEELLETLSETGKVQS